MQPGLLFCGNMRLLLVLLVLSAWASVKAEDWKPADTAAAKAFCARPEFKQLRCGLAKAEEQDKTTARQCPLCGTAYRGLPAAPAVIEGVDRYPQSAVDVVSLACQGRAIVRKVFKIVKQPSYRAGKDCSGTMLDLIHAETSSKAGPTIRCELELPSGSGSEQQRATRAKEGKCWICTACPSSGETAGNNFGCPSTIGQWYVDTVVTSFRGCTWDAKDGYAMERVGFNIRPGVTIEMAKFEVCNDPGCFDQAAEAAKLARAKLCWNGKCT